MDINNAAPVHTTYLNVSRGQSRSVTASKIAQYTAMANSRPVNIGTSAFYQIPATVAR